MKNTKILLASLAALLSVGQAALGYIYEFSNHTTQPVNVRIKLAGINEPYYEKMIYPKQMGEFRFVFGEGPFDFSRKAGFCLQTLQIQEPQVGAGGAITFGPWREIDPKFIPSVSYDQILKGAEAFAEFAGSAAALGAGAATGGATEVVSGIAGGAQDFSLDKIVQAIGAWVKYSLCANRHFDIVRTKDGFDFVTLAR